MKIFTQLYWNLLGHLVIAANWPQLVREFQGSILKYKKACTSLFIYDLSPESVKHTVCFVQSKDSNINLRCYVLLLLNLTTSAFLLVRATEDAKDIFTLNTSSRCYVFFPPHSDTDKNGEFAIIAGLFMSFPSVCIWPTLLWSQRGLFPWLCWPLNFSMLVPMALCFLIQVTITSVWDLSLSRRKVGSDPGY